jgi:nitric oxide reductase subunit B
VLQAIESFRNGYWSARSVEFYQQPIVNKLLWLRMVPDTVFIVVGILPIVAAACYGLMHIRSGRRATVSEVKPLEVGELVGASRD